MSDFHDIADLYRKGDFDKTLDEIFSIAAGSGVVLLPGEDHPFTNAKGGPYEVKDLLIPVDLSTWKTLTKARQAGLNVFPEWFAWTGDHFDYTQDSLCQAFVKYYHLTREKGVFLADGNPVTEDDIKEALRRSLAIVRKDAGSLLYGTFTALKSICKDSVPPAKRDRLSIAAMAQELEARGYGARYNLISKEYEIIGRTDTDRAMSQDDLVTKMHDSLADQYKGITFDVLARYTVYIAQEHQYTPVLEALAASQWDGVDRLPQLYALIGIENDSLSKALVRKWLMQAVALLFNDPADPFGADGCLVLNGEQGVGKTSLFRHLAMKNSWFGEGMTVNDHDKDTTRRIVSVWIAELGEVESTLKSDISSLKAFVTDSEDHYRLPYGRADIVSPRLTSLCATCNSDRYLIDPTGNRRWWSVPFNRTVSHEELLELNALQLWAQIYALVAPLSYQDKSACYRLTDGEKAALALRNGEYEKPMKGQLEVEDILAQAEADGLVFKDMTVAAFKEEWPVLRGYTVQQIGAALTHCGITTSRNKKARTRELPTHDKAALPWQK